MNKCRNKEKKRTVCISWNRSHWAEKEDLPPTDHLSKTTTRRNNNPRSRTQQRTHDGSTNNRTTHTRSTRMHLLHLRLLLLRSGGLDDDGLVAARCEGCDGAIGVLYCVDGLGLLLLLLLLRLWRASLVSGRRGGLYTGRWGSVLAALLGHVICRARVFPGDRRWVCVFVYKNNFQMIRELEKKRFFSLANFPRVQSD